MKQYLDIVDNVLHNGVKKDNRTGISTISTFAETFRHDMSEGFPLLTTKKMAINAILVELEGFIKGITSKKWYQDRGCNIWNEWSNPLAGPGDDLGPIYGYQWRRFGQVYDEDDDGCLFKHDQFNNIINTLKNNPHDRRMVCSAWNPIHASRMALPPCHVLWNVVILGDKLNLAWYQRSCDLMLGVPYNIASYATLLLLLCKESGFKPGILHGTLSDCHIYENQIDQAKHQINRIAKQLPTMDIVGTGDFNIYNWRHDLIELKNYNPHPKIDFGPVAV